MTDLLCVVRWPAGLRSFWLGATVLVASLLFAVWAREHLGTFAEAIDKLPARPIGRETLRSQD